MLHRERSLPNWYFFCEQSIPTGFMTTTIRPEGESDAWLEGSLGNVAELGAFRAKVDRALLKPFLIALADSGYEAVSDVSVMYPDTPFVDITERIETPSGKRTIVSKWFELRSLPDEVRPVMVELAKLIDELRRFPEYVVRANGKWTPPTARPEGPIIGRIQLHNPGGKPATFYHPKGPQKTKASVTLLVRTTGKNPELQQAELKPEELELVDTQGAPVPATEKIVLAPGQTFELRLQKAFYLAPGKYDAAVSLNLAQGDIPWGTAVCGTLVVHMGMFDVSVQ